MASSPRSMGPSGIHRPSYRLAAGAALLIADLIIDQRWSHWIPSKEPGLNRRGDQLIGQVLTVVEPIGGGGRGSVRATDSVWPAEGAYAMRGAKVRVAGCKGTLLTVEPPEARWRAVVALC